MRAFCRSTQRKWTSTAAPTILTGVPALSPLARLYSTATPSHPLPPRTTRCRVRSVVGRSEVHHICSTFATSSVVPPCGGGVRPLQFAESDSTDGATTAEYDLYGTPVGGPLLSHAFVDQLKIYASLLLALALTKCAFDALRFDMIYYDLWKVGLRWSSLWRERVEYYISTAMVGLSLLCGVSANFIAVTTLLGRRQLGMYVLRRLARRAVVPITRK